MTSELLPPFEQAQSVILKRFGGVAQVKSELVDRVDDEIGRPNNIVFGRILFEEIFHVLIHPTR